MTRDVRVPEEVSGTAFPCFALDGSTDKPARTDTERMDWLEREKPELIGAGIYLHSEMYWARNESDDEARDTNHRTMREAIDAAMDAESRAAAREAA
jgi:hypothetical protein